MKTKRILRFYFRAERLDRALNNLINKRAFSPSIGASAGAEAICAVIEEKRKLATLWEYLDGVMAKLGELDKSVLARYADMRCGLSAVSAERRREVRRAVVKFTRRALRLESFAEGVALVHKYYCLL